MQLMQKESEVSRIRGARKVGLGALLVGLAVACTPPPPPSAATVALEGRLLTEADVGSGFAEESRGRAGVSGGMICPEADFETADVGVVRVAFVRGSGRDEIGLDQVLRVAEQGELDRLFVGMRDAYEACFGVVWTDYGDTRMVEPLMIPEVGDDRIAVHAVRGDPPFDGRHDDDRGVIVRSGDILIEITVSEVHDSAQTPPSLGDEEFLGIVAKALEKLTG